MLIGSNPGESVYQGRTASDTFLVVNLNDCMLYLYQVVDTMLCPTTLAVGEYHDRPYFWSNTTGMMYILSPVSQCSFSQIQTADDAVGILESMEAFLETV